MKKYTHYIIDEHDGGHSTLWMRGEQTIRIDFKVVDESIRLYRYKKYAIQQKKGWKKWDWKIVKPILFAWMHEAFSAVTNEIKK